MERQITGMNTVARTATPRKKTLVTTGAAACPLSPPIKRYRPPAQSHAQNTKTNRRLLRD
jgi:hypothetical protein